MRDVLAVRAYAELNDFLPAEHRGRAVTRPVRSHQTVKDVIEAMGIPHTEIEVVLVDGVSVDFAHRPRVGARVAVYPVFEAFDVSGLIRVRPAPLREPRFVVDVNVGRLAKVLRLLGFDVSYEPEVDDPALAQISRDENRILLTRDRGLLARRAVTHGLYVRGERAHEQAVEVIRRLDLADRIQPFTRCLRCNGTLEPVDKREIVDRLEPLTRQHYDEFRRCRDCQRVYWRGSHQQRLAAQVDAIRAELPNADRPDSR
ncbi:Mut7-C RNAse domain-containing protein [Aldersonia kunmingensis]|uniref:Mut7-C RNAse domain-containing protein n=1 Tax=Aldersonia kunmingensis TaxID=408066 RepID=UPI0008311396|nr:Mut7-C RNAse domain-containing protein [Aldersonia kunmingensis]